MVRSLLTSVFTVAALSFGSTVTQAASFDRGNAGGTWTLTGSLGAARSSPIAATLPNGKVLVSGGLDDKNHAMASAELFDPSNGRWTPTAPMKDDRWGATMTVLASGKVLVAGGDSFSAGGVTARAELYDPATGKWTRTGSMGVPREMHTATVLANGNVLVAGGQATSRLGGITSAELYDPHTGKWASTGSMTTPREQHAASLLATGEVLVTGGFSDPLAGSLGSAETYDPKTGRWTMTAGRMMTSRYAHTSAALADGSAIVAGGAYGTATGLNPLAMTDRYDPATRRWLPVGDMLVAAKGIPALAGRWVHGTRLLPDGRVLVAGGTGYIAEFQINKVLATAELFDPKSNSWTLTGSMHVARDVFAATVLLDGRTLVVGGGGRQLQPLASAEIYAPPSSVSARSMASSNAAATRARIAPAVAPRAARVAALGRAAIGKWVLTGSMHVARVGAPATLLADGKVLVEGCDSAAGGKTAELYDPARGTWALTGSMQVARCLHSAILLADGRVLVAGGGSAANVWSSAEIYDPATKRWSMTGHMNSTRFDTAIVMLSNGKLLAPAGAAVNTIPRDSDDLYDPATGTWTPAPSLNLSRYAHSTVALADGVALVVGGFAQNSQNTNTSELYDPAANAWTFTGSTTRQEQDTTLLGDGTVLATPGSELYTQATGKWVRTKGGMKIPRINASFTLLSDGRALAAGGCAGSSCVLVRQSELYDPSSQTWSLDAPLNVPRYVQSAVRLADGRVLIAGGFTSGFVRLSSAEVYARGIAR